MNRLIWLFLLIAPLYGAVEKAHSPTFRALSGKNQKFANLLYLGICRFTNFRFSLENHRKIWGKRLSQQPLAVVRGQKNKEDAESLTVDENLHNGKVLILSDGSTWEVAPQDLPTSQTWIFPSPLKVEKNGTAAFPYRITSLQTGSSILVRPIAPIQSPQLDVMH
ncbi:hypothetical protein [Candidatus Neptunochlamydia vexilliferae]|nr:hypothetical protein [Candidatus Neptunochlamydia vexilliferae]